VNNCIYYTITSRDLWEAVPIPTSTIPTFQRCTDVEVRRRLRSSSISTLIVPSSSTLRSTLGDRTFPVAAARAWNALPSSAKFIAKTIRLAVKTTLRLTVDTESVV